MRIIQPCGPSHRDDGACLYLKKYFNMMKGVTCERKSMFEKQETWGDYDAIVYVDWGQDNFLHLPGVEIPRDVPSLCWQSDTHWTPAAKDYRFTQSKMFSIAAMCQKKAQVEFGGKAVWLPHAADHLIYHPPIYTTSQPHGWPPVEDEGDPKAMFSIKTNEVTPVWDLCFVGHIGDPGRTDTLDRMFSAIPNFNFEPGVFFEDAARIFHQSALVFNHSVRGELNMRTFESLASRSCLLTDRQEGMDTLGLNHLEHALIYESVDHAIELAKEWIDPSKRVARREMAERGWRWVLGGHTYWHRARTILDLLNLKV